MAFWATTTATDEKGGFLLEGTLPERTYLLVAAPGFRFRGWPAVPAREPKEHKLILVRTSEQPERHPLLVARPDFV